MFQNFVKKKEFWELIQNCGRMKFEFRNVLPQMLGTKLHKFSHLDDLLSAICTPLMYRNRGQTKL
jgi:hypothetical protein